MATPIPTNDAAFTIAEILHHTGGDLFARGTGPSDVSGVSTDTRTVTAGSCFVALRGEVHDGHAHLATAADKGAAAVLVEHDVTPPPAVAVIRVRSTLTALGDLARAHTRRWRAAGGQRTVVGITGSAGKTTTRVATSALLGRLFPGEVHGAQGNLNNRIGMPMVLFGLTPGHRLAVLEMGMNQPGEIAELCRIAEPDVGVVTLVAAAHTEGLGGLDGVAREKAALFESLREDGVAIGNGDDAVIREALARSRASRRYLYGHAADAAVRLAAREPVGMTGSRLVIERAGRAALSFETPLLGEAGALATAATVAVVELALGATLDSALCAEAFAVADVGAGAGRLVPRVLPGDLAVIDDTYNANPASTCASIRAAAEIARTTGRRLILVLGEMRELGTLSAGGHDDVGSAAAASGAADVFSVGSGESHRIASRAREGGVRAMHAARVEDVSAQVLLVVRPGDLVLVKGSRSIGTERVVTALAQRSTAPQDAP
jgi:UDP-N-acetylmuramoyl-tripeptide--D-alanyl-D-alanine ligase